jgi:hypothetical protein
VGSGPAAVQAAQTIAESGAMVTMLDVGITNEEYKDSVPDSDFENLRQTDQDQYKYFLGNDFETIPLGNLKVGAQLTPPRKHLIRDVNRLIPMESETFFPMECLAYGGLGAGWGLGCYVYSDNELIKAGLEPEEFKKAYSVIAGRIGISCGNDDATSYTTAHLSNILPPLLMDNSLKQIYKRYNAKKATLNSKSIYFGNAPIAMLSEDYNGRKKTPYHDMDFYSDKDGYSYRAWMTVEELKKLPNFEYIDKCLVLSFSEDTDCVTLKILHTDTNKISELSCNKLMLTAGPLGNARIVLRSLKNHIQRLPVLCNPYTYLPCLNIGMLGKPLDRFKSSMAQAVLFFDKEKSHSDVVSVALFTYRSLMLYKLIKEAPVDFADGRIIMQYLQSAFVIAGIHHPDEPADTKYLEMHSDDSCITGDKLFAHYTLNNEEKLKVKNNEKQIRKALRSLGCYPIQRMDPGYGSSIHYAGTLPFSESDTYGTTGKNGQLNGFKRIFVADASAFRYLPAKGITFTLMANAHVVAQNSLNE